MWRGEHIGPEGTMSGVVFAEKAAVIGWLATMMALQRLKGCDAAIRELAAGDAAVGVSLGEHWFAIREDR